MVGVAKIESKGIPMRIVNGQRLNRPMGLEGWKIAKMANLGDVIEVIIGDNVKEGIIEELHLDNVKVRVDSLKGRNLFRVINGVIVAPWCDVLSIMKVDR